MQLTEAELTTIKNAIIDSKAALEKAVDVARKYNGYNLYALLDWTAASLANQLNYVNDELSKQSSRFSA